MKVTHITSNPGSGKLGMINEDKIVTDGSVKNRGIAATLYTNRSNRLLLVGFFNAKLWKQQVHGYHAILHALVTLSNTLLLSSSNPKYNSSPHWQQTLYPDLWKIKLWRILSQLQSCNLPFHCQSLPCARPPHPWNWYSSLQHCYPPSCRVPCQQLPDL